jgi:hypothetical protein
MTLRQRAEALLVRARANGQEEDAALLAHIIAVIDARARGEP